MGRYELEYPKDATNLVKRHGERANNERGVATGVYALEKIHSLINGTQLLHVSFNPPGSPFPVTLPMIGQMGSFDRPSASLGDPLDLYIHGYVSARMFNVGRDAGAEGVPVCIAASHVDGLVLAVSAFNHSYNYRSAVLFGHAYLVTDEAEKLYAMELITDSVVPQRWRNSRLPPTGAELQSTSLLRIKIASGSAKFRDGGVVDDKHDLENEDALNSVWTGVVPIWSTMGEPIPSGHNRVDLPKYASEFFDEFSKDNKELALSAASKQPGA
ncbi:flavin-nucleotide-binding protein [Purpureocillium lavendulum]|uniref:Flavin-nucleotide-binding protein n=1 Tax=Purpureocillium lavendulum TaxID=1247861 RepID=A0AB34FFX2_9HYPO|nr:flavin-nucleotide-binding protein [Purpureocillium lavendulum]